MLGNLTDLIRTVKEIGEEIAGLLEEIRDELRVQTPPGGCGCRSRATRCRRSSPSR